MAGQKLGFYSLRKASRAVCRFIYVFSPVLKKTYPDNETLHNALDAANSACAALIDIIDILEPSGV